MSAALDDLVADLRATGTAAGIEAGFWRGIATGMIGMNGIAPDRLARIGDLVHESIARADQQVGPGMQDVLIPALAELRRLAT